MLTDAQFAALLAASPALALSLIFLGNKCVCSILFFIRR